MSTPARQSVAILIPALNEAATIAAVVQRAAQIGVPLVIDDGSMDGTGAAAQTAGAQVIRLAQNQGYECALSVGMRQALDQGFVFALTMDADGQHGLESARLVLAAMRDDLDLVIGTRSSKPRLGEVLAGWLGSFLWRVSDPFSGLKLYRLASCTASGDFDSRRLVGAELLARCHRRGLALTTVPIITQARADQSRYGVSFRANFKLLRALLLLTAVYLGLL